MAKNTFKAKENKGEGLCSDIEMIKDQIRKSSYVRARLTEEEKEKFNKKIEELHLSESNVVRQLVDGLMSGKFIINS